MLNEGIVYFVRILIKRFKVFSSLILVYHRFLLSRCFLLLQHYSISKIKGFNIIFKIYKFFSLCQVISFQDAIVFLKTHIFTIKLFLALRLSVKSPPLFVKAK